MANPILNDNFGEDAKSQSIERTLDNINPEMQGEKVYNGELVIDSEPMTISGTLNKLLMLFLFVIAGAYATWTQFMAGMLDKVNMLVTVGGIAGFILAMIVIFNKKTAPLLSPFYAICEGLVLGGVSAIAEKAYPGIVIPAVISSFAALGVMFSLYRARLIRCTERFNAIILTALLSICVIYLIQFVAQFFGRSIPLLFGNGPVGLGFSAIVIVVAALSFIQDFDFIERASEKMLPKYYEWYGAFGVMITFIWLYMEILRFLAKVNSRR